MHGSDFKATNPRSASTEVNFLSHSLRLCFNPYSALCSLSGPCCSKPRRVHEDFLVDVPPLESIGNVKLGYPHPLVNRQRNEEPKKGDFCHRGIYNDNLETWN